MKSDQKLKAIKLRESGLSIKEIALRIGVAKSSVSIWVRNIQLSPIQLAVLKSKGHTLHAIEKRRQTRLFNEEFKRSKVITAAKHEVSKISYKELWLIGVMLYWAEGGKTQRMVRFSNGDPNMIKIIMKFFRIICKVPEKKFRGYIHIHPHLNHISAERYWSDITLIPVEQFFKTYRKQNKSSQNKKDSLPYGVLDIYVLDVQLFLKIKGWAEGIFHSY